MWHSSQVPRVIDAGLSRSRPQTSQCEYGPPLRAEWAEWAEWAGSFGGVSTRCMRSRVQAGSSCPLRYPRGPSRSSRIDVTFADWERSSPHLSIRQRAPHTRCRSPNNRGCAKSDSAQGPSSTRIHWRLHSPTRSCADPAARPCREAAPSTRLHVRPRHRRGLGRSSSSTIRRPVATRNHGNPFEWAPPLLRPTDAALGQFDLEALNPVPHLIGPAGERLPQLVDFIRRFPPSPNRRWCHQGRASTGCGSTGTRCPRGRCGELPAIATGAKVGI